MTGRAKSLRELTLQECTAAWYQSIAARTSRKLVQRCKEPVMDDTLQGPPVPHAADIQQPSTSVTPVTAAPAPTTQTPTADTGTMRVPDFVKDLDLTATQETQTTPPAPVSVPGWREQLPIASVAIVLGAALVAWSLWQRRRVMHTRSDTGTVRSGMTRPGADHSSTAHAAKRTHAKLTVQESIAVQRDVSDLTEKLAQQSEAMAHQLDVRTARLETLLAQADDRIAALEKQLAARPAAAIEAKPAASHTAAPAPAHASTPFERLEAPGMQHRDVYTLADSGLTPVQIAQRLGKPTGQVELILNLRRAAV